MPVYTYARVGKRWAVGMPLWLWVITVGPFWMIWAMLVIGWDILLFTWWALVWTYKAFEWLVVSTSRDIQKIRSHYAQKK